MMPRGYYAYHNHATKAAILHHASCGKCQGGLGQMGRPNYQEGKWHGPFLSRGDARDFARTLNVLTLRDCRMC